MARARNIKPGLFKNEILGEADPLLTLLFVGLWTLADREGRLEDRPVRIKGELFPYRDGVDVNAMLDWLQRSGFIQRYQANGVAVIQILQFAKHQAPHGTEKDSDLPDANGNYTVHERGKNGYATGSIALGNRALTVKAPSDNALIPDSGFLIPDSGSNASPPASPPPSPPSPKAKKPKAVKTAMPEDFGVSARVVTWAAQKGYGQLQEHLEAFKRKAAANGYRYADWDAAFMEAIREDWAKLRGRTPNGAAPPATTPTPGRHTDSYEETQRLLAERNRGTTGMPAEIRQFTAQLTGRKAA